jgi:hypothetical protein
MLNNQKIYHCSVASHGKNTFDHESCRFDSEEFDLIPGMGLVCSYNFWIYDISIVFLITPGNLIEYKPTDILGAHFAVSNHPCLGRYKFEALRVGTNILRWFG